MDACSFDTFESFLAAIPTPTFPKQLYSSFIGTYDCIKSTQSLLSLAADFPEDSPEEATFSLFKQLCLTLLKTIVPSLLLECQKSGNDETNKKAEVLAKWWITYLTILSEAFNKKESMWTDDNTKELWFEPLEESLLIDSLKALEDHLHWKMILIRGILCTQSFFTIIGKLENFNYEKNYQDLRSYCVSLARKEIDAIRKQQKKEDLNLRFRRKMLENLVNIMRDEGEKNQENIKFSIIYGFFERKKYKNLYHSVILGEDGGFYTLMNRIDTLERKMLLETGEIEEDYLKFCVKAEEVMKNLEINEERVLFSDDTSSFSPTKIPTKHEKTQAAPEESKNDEKTLEIVEESKGPSDKPENIEAPNKVLQKIIIGKGTFGTIRICMALTRKETPSTMKPGQIVCVKKTAYYNKRLSKYKFVPLCDIIENAWNDYSVGEIGNLIYSPEVFDMRIVSPTSKIDQNHQKGYTIQKFMPVYDGSKVFGDGGTYVNNWAHQRSYLLSIFEVTSKLLDRGVCMTDMKTQNTLYDGENYRGMLIDLAGVVRKTNRKQLEKTNVKDIKELTKEFTAIEVLIAFEDAEEEPEEGEEKKEIYVDLCKAMSFSLGMMITKVVIKYPTDKKYYNDMKALCDQMKETDIENRITVEQGLEILKKIGAEEIMETVDFKEFMGGLIERTEMNLKKFGLNPNLIKIEQSFINLQAATLDPSKYDNLTFTSLEKDLQSFLSISDLSHIKEKVFVLLGSSGSGKSTILQLKYLETLRNWKENQPIPIYLNLSLEDDLKARWEWLLKEINIANDKLKFNLFSGYAKYPVLLFIDSFDEVASKINFVSKFLQDLGNNPFNRCLICCRSEFIQKERDLVTFFKPPNVEMTELMRRYIAPLSATNFSFNDYVKKYYSVWGDKENTIDIATILKKILEKNIENMMKTGYMVHLTLEVLPDIIKSGDNGSITKAKIHERYSRKKMEKIEENLKEFLLESLGKTDFVEVSENAAMKLAKILNKIRTTKIDNQKAPNFFSKYHYNHFISCFENQVLSAIFRSLDLQVETKGSIPNEIITIGFEHDSMKNYFLVRAIMNECKEKHKNKVLGERVFVTDECLMGFLVEAVKENLWFREELVEVIYRSRKNNGDISEGSEEETAVNAAANGISVLIAANINFSGCDLRGVRIRGANLRDGVFSYSDFTDADLCSVVLENAKLEYTIFNRTNLRDLKLGIYPNIHIRTSATVSAFSPDFKEIIVGTQWSTIKMFDRENNNKLKKDFGGLTMAFFSPDGKQILARSTDHAIKILDSQSFKTVGLIDAHSADITCLKYSKDGKFFISCSIDKTIKIFDSSSLEQLQFPHELKNSVNSLSISDDNLRIAIGLTDGTLVLCDRKTGAILWKKEWGVNELDNPVCHTKNVNAVEFLSDSEVVSVSTDGTIKIWDITAGILLKNLEISEEEAYEKGGKTGVLCIVIRNQGEIIAGYDDGSIRFWEKSTCTTQREFHYHESSVTCLTLPQSNPSHLLSGSKDQSIKLWDFKTNTLLREFNGHGLAIASISLSPDDKTLISSSHDNSLKLWDFETSKLLKSFSGPHNDLSKPGAVASTVYSRDGAFLVSTSTDGIIRVWDHKSTFCVREIEATAILSVISPDGSFILSGGKDNFVRIWGFQDGKLWKTMEGHKGVVYALDVTSDSSLILSGSQDKTMKLWAVSTGVLIRTFEAKGEVRTVKFSADGTIFLSGGTDKSVILWETASGAILKTLNGHTDNVSSVKFSPDGSLILSASQDGLIKLWDRASGVLLKTFDGHAGPVLEVNFANDNTFLSSSYDKTARLWDLSTGSLLKSFDGHLVMTNVLNAVCFSKDGGLFATGGKDKKIKIWNKATAELMRTIEAASTVFCLAFSNGESQFLASGTLDKLVKIWERGSGLLVKSLAGHTMPVYSVDFAREGEILVSGSMDKTIRVWNFKSGVCLKVIDGFKNTLNCVRFSADGTQIVASYEDNSFKLWDATSGSLAKSFAGHSKTVSCVAFSHSGTQILSGSFDNRLKLWDRSSGEALKYYYNHTDAVYCLAFAPDDSWFVSGSLDKTIKIWDKLTGAVLKTLEGHNGLIKSLDISKDGQFIVSASWDNTVRVWKKRVNNIIRTMCVSHDQKYFLVSSDTDGSVDFYEKSRGSFIRKLQGIPNTFVLKVSFSENDDYIVCQYTDGSIKIWKTLTGNLIKTLSGEEEKEKVTLIAIDEENHRFFTRSLANINKIWDLNTGQVIRSFESSDLFKNVDDNDPELKFLLAKIILGIGGVDFFCEYVVGAKETRFSCKNMLIFDDVKELSESNLMVYLDPERGGIHAKIEKKTE